MRIFVSSGTQKMGEKVYNISLPPVESCPPGVPCAKEGCYTLKGNCRAPTVINAWRRNFQIYKEDNIGYFEQLAAWFTWQDYTEPVEHFRWHVGGDIPDRDYFTLMTAFARTHPDTKFMAFTKNYPAVIDYGAKHIPENLSVIFSAWPGYPIPQGVLPIAWLDNPKEPDPRIPRKARSCHGKCVDCMQCWSLKKPGDDVVLHKH